LKTHGMPLPLTLTEPVLLAGDLESQFRGEYDPTTQLCGGGTNTRSNNSTKSTNLLGIQVDVSADVQVDDVIG
jgi:hypothetical protein